MSFRRLVRVHRNEKGITLMELVMAMGVTAVILGSVTATLWQVFAMNSRSINHMTAVRQVQSAGYWVSRDALMAQTVSPTAPSGFPLRLIWTDWGGVVHDVTYSIVNNRLKRSQGASDSFIASYIDSATACSWSDGKLILTVKATVGSGSTAGTETRVYEVVPRTGQ